MEVEIEGSRCRPTDVFLYEVKWERAFPANKYYQKPIERNRKVENVERKVLYRDDIKIVTQEEDPSK